MQLNRVFRSGSFSRAAARRSALAGLAAFAVAGVLACGEESGSQKLSELSTDTTKIVAVGGVQAVFDLVSMEDHHKMMEMMNLSDMQHAAGADRHVSLTLIEKQSGKHLTDDAVESVSFRLQTPDGASSEPESLIMEGGGMFHWGFDLQTQGPGVYTVTAVIEREGGVLEPTAEFTIE